MMIGISNKSFSELYSDHKPKCKKESALAVKGKVKNIKPLCPSMKYSCWYYVEFEKELPVCDLCDIESKVPWMFPEKEEELEVKDLMIAEQIVPYWMIIEKEDELEVTNLVNYE